jgi:hypothetical protein
MNPRNRLKTIDKLYASLNRGHLLGTRDGKMILVGLGTLMAGAGQLITDPPSGTPWNRVVGIIGVVLAFVGGWWTMRAEKHAPQALEEARLAIQESLELKAHSEALRSQVEAAFDSMRQASRHQRQLLALSRTTIEIAEHLTMNRSSRSLNERLARFLRLSERPLLAGMRINGGERWTLSIYVPDGENLVRVAAACADRTTSVATGRPWKIGQGFVGAAYQRRGDLVLADAQMPEIQAMLNVPAPSSSDASRYKSIAAITVRVDGMPDPPWGVVIGTSDRKGRFDTESKSEGAANTEAIRMLASAVALIVSGAHTPSHKTSAPATKRLRPSGAAKKTALNKNG